LIGVQGCGGQLGAVAVVAKDMRQPEATYSVVGRVELAEDDDAVAAQHGRLESPTVCVSGLLWLIS
jgi:hypothetical protein